LDWIGINSSNISSYCGHTTTYTLAGAINGTGRWLHYVDEVHWFILDLKKTYFITKVRGRSADNYDPTNVDIYVSDNISVWGAAVATGIASWVDITAWSDVNITPKKGRFVKAVVNTTEEANRSLTWSKSSAAYMTIFDVYGEPVVESGTLQLPLGLGKKHAGKKTISKIL